MIARAADMDYLPALHALAWAYREGLGVARDERQATHLFERAAVAGYAESQYMLGLSYAQGSGVPVDGSMALLWIKRAAEQGHAGARQALAGLSLSVPSP
ncbi:MAG: hypothetical protein RQ754_16525 [Desulfuromonadales bacterium]|nr:hypothetical protein [Desulfuromonadales bacterium]